MPCQSILLTVLLNQSFSYAFELVLKMKYVGIKIILSDSSYQYENWADVADKICFGHTLKFGSGSEFSVVQ